MRRFLTTLMILLVVLVAGFSALVLLVNPNDFRAYMVKQVAARSGYQLQLDGPLRWHVWPQLSILSGRVVLTAEGASEPLVRADNMRLDVALWPLLSHQLSVKQVMLKGAVIQLTPKTEAVRAKDAPVAPKDNMLPDLAEDKGWSFDIARLRLPTVFWYSSMKTTNKLPFVIFVWRWNKIASTAARLIFPGV